MATSNGGQISLQAVPEVVNIIFGSIHQVILELEQYRTLESDGLSSIGLRSNCGELLSVISELKCRRRGLQDAFEELLATQQQMRARLWESTPVFQGIINGIVSAIKNIKQEVDAQKDRKTLELRCGIFTLNRLQFETYLSIIQNAESKLDAHFDNSVELAPARKARSQTKLFLRRGT
jgi:hypothetical protein